MTDTIFTQAQMREQLESQLADARDKNSKLADSIKVNERAAAAAKETEAKFVTELKKLEAREAALLAREQSLQADQAALASAREQLATEQTVFSQVRAAAEDETKRLASRLEADAKSLEQERNRQEAALGKERLELDARSQEITRKETALSDREAKTQAHEGRVRLAAQKLEKEQAAWRSTNRDKLLKIADSL